MRALRYAELREGVWTRPDNEAAVRLYRSAGFEPSRQLVLTWYPIEPEDQAQT